MQTFFKEKLPKPQKLAEILTIHSFETEIVDGGIEVSILSNRAADCLSYRGLAREIGAILNHRVNYQLSSEKISNQSKNFDISIKDVEACPRYMMTQWSGVTVSDSGKEIKAGLQGNNLKSINNAVDLVNYLMLEMGQPIHVFDADKIEGLKIEVRWAKKEEKFVSLDDKKYSLSPDILVIADKAGPLAIAGIKGGKRAEVDKNTKNILIEAANFDFRAIRRASKLLNLKTDASWLFENGLDPNMVEEAQKRLITLGKKILKPKRIALIDDVYKNIRKDWTIDLDLNWLQELLGTSVKPTEITAIFKRLNFQVKVISKHKIQVKIPTWRPDVRVREDLAEEFGRIYGYDLIKSSPPRTILIQPIANRNNLWKRVIRDSLVQLGMSESRLYALLSAKDFSLFGYDSDRAIELLNPISNQYQYLRWSLLPNLLRALKENAKRFNQVNIFEIGKIFQKPEQEKEVLAGVYYDVQSKNDGFYELKGIVESLLSRLGITDARFDDHQAEGYFGGNKTWHPIHRAEIKVGSEIIGFLGEIHPRLGEDLSLPEFVYAFEINLEALIQLANDQQEYQPISLYPAIVRDISIVVPDDVKIEEAIYQISTAGGELIRDVDLLDVYYDDRLDGEKSMTFRIVYQSMDKNLSAADISALEKNIFKILQELNWHLRS